MPFLKNLASFRGRLIIGLIIPVIILFGFNFYTFTQSRHFDTLLQTTPLTQTEIAIKRGLHDFLQVSFFFLSLIIILNLGIATILVVILTFSLRTILNGIKKIEGGDLSFRIPLNSQDEFGTIAQFLNTATAKVEIVQRSIEQKVEQRTKQLVQEQARFKASVDSLSLGFIMTDDQDKVITFNPAVEKIFGPDNKELTIHQLAQEFRESLDLQQLLHKSRDEKKIININEASYKGKAVRLLIAPILISTEKGVVGEEVIGSVVLLEDKTEEKQLEKMKLDFVSMAAHELRTPITAIKGYLHVFIRNYQTILNTEQTNILDKISIATTRLVSLVENLLNVTKIEKGTLRIEPQAVDWTDYIRGIISEMSEQARQKQLDLLFTVPKVNLPKVLVDKTRIGEVLSNLLSNAITYTPAKGRITVWAENNGREVITHVADTGIGISKEALPKLFTKFFRVSGSFEAGIKGTGLGLYIAKAIIEAHRGRIWVESETSKGSIFSFSLPTSG